MININCNDEKLKKLIWDFVIFKFPQNYNIGEIFLNIFVNNNICTLELSFNEEKNSFNIRFSDKDDLIKSIKRFLLNFFDDKLDLDKSFGILNGVRPLKLFRKIRQVNTLENTKKILRDRYLLANEEIELLSTIYNNQKNIVDKCFYRNYSIYIHIPFCPSICSYCSFDTMLYNEEKVIIYLKTLLKELKEISIYYDKPPNTIYIGGGTPSVISINDLEKIIDTILKYYGSPNEFTVECGRVDTFSLKLLKMLKEKSVTRISINPQSFNEKIVMSLNRNCSNFLKWFEKTKEMNFDTINMDLILGLPGESRESIINSIDITKNLGPENITIHTLALKKGSDLFNKNYINDNDYGDILKYSKDLMKDVGYKPYYIYRQKRMAKSGENIGYAKEDHLCLYNILVMEETEDILGFGLGASTKILNKTLKFKRSFNYKNLNDYVNRINDIIIKKSQLIEKKEDIF